MFRILMLVKGKLKFLNWWKKNQVPFSPKVNCKYIKELGVKKKTITNSRGNMGEYLCPDEKDLLKEIEEITKAKIHGFDHRVVNSFLT